MMNIFQLLKKYRYEMPLVRSNCLVFDLWRFNKIWYFDNILKKEPLVAGYPWMNYSSILFLESIIRPGFNVFEFGSGGSSVFFLRKKVNLISVEHVKEWVDKLNECVSLKLRKNWKLISVQEKIMGDFPERDYVNPLDDLENNSQDLISVDGRNRVCCVKRAVIKVKPGGYLLLDNSDREQYEEAHHYMKAMNWEIFNFSGLCFADEWGTQSVFWRKPVG